MGNEEQHSGSCGDSRTGADPGGATLPHRSANELGRVLPERIRLLSSVIARKPKSFSPMWASSVDEAFSLYTRTSTVNLINSLNQWLIEMDWPFPAFLNLAEEVETGVKQFSDMVAGRRRRWSSKRSLTSVAMAGVGQKDVTKKTQVCDAMMVALFNDHRKELFRLLEHAHVLKPKRAMLREITETYRRRLWAASITTTVPLLDYIMRQYFETGDLRVSLQTLRNGFFDKAKLRAKDVMPGHSVWEGARDPQKGNIIAKSVDEDLRLPGVYLSSFLEFADRYYEWYESTTSAPRTPLNRHAIMHCASEYWTEANAVRILTFLHLTTSLEPVIKILVLGEDALGLVAKLKPRFRPTS